MRKPCLKTIEDLQKAVGYPVENVVLSNQVHETKILRVDEKRLWQRCCQRIGYHWHRRIDYE